MDWGGRVELEVKTVWSRKRWESGKGEKGENKSVYDKDKGVQVKKEWMEFNPKTLLKVQSFRLPKEK